MATDLGELVYTLTLNDSGFASKLDENKDKTVESSEQMSESLDKTSESGSKLGGIFGGMAGQIALGSAIFSVGQMAIDKVKGAIDDAVQAQKDWQTATQQTVAGIKSTGDASGMTAEQVEKLAEKTQDSTSISREAVLTGENMLLTFTGIGKQVFPQATQAVADMATRMNGGAVPSMQQMNNTALQLGKALNDPAKGLTMLQREGVTFDAQETQNIKTMVAHNDVAGAQKVMLNELSKEFGGSAAAAAQTYEGRIDALKNKMNDLISEGMQKGEAVLASLGQAFVDALPTIEKFGGYIVDTLKPVLEDIGEFFKLLWITIGDGDPTMVGFNSRFKDMAVFLVNLQPAIDDVKEFFKLLWEVISGGDPTLDANHLQFIGIVKALDSVKQIVTTVAGILKADFIAAWNILKIAVDGLMPSIKSLVGTLVTQLRPIIIEIWQAFTRLWQALSPVLMDTLKVVAVIVGVTLYGAIWLAINALRVAIDVLGFVVNAFADVIKWVADFIGWIGDAVSFISDHWRGILEILIAPFVPALAIWLAFHNQIIAFFRDAVSVVEGVWNSVVGFFSRIVGNITSTIKGGVSGFGNLLFDAGKNIVQGLINGINNMFGDAEKAIQNLGGKITDSAKKILKIFSPSQVFADIGNNVSLGMAQGIGAGSDTAVQATKQMTTSVVAAGVSVPGVVNNQNSSSVGGNNYNFAGANFNFSTAESVDEFFSIGNRNTQLESGGIAPLARTVGV